MSMDSLMQLSNVACLDDSRLSSEASSDDESKKSNDEDTNSSTPPNLSQSNSGAPIFVPNSKRAINAVTEFERCAVRDKIKSAFRKKASSYDELLDLSSKVIEQQVMESGSSKLDYYKAGIANCKRIFDASNSESLSIISPNATDAKSQVELNEDGAPKPVKRAKTQH